MPDYRDPDVILEEIRDLENIIISNKELLKKYSTDLALRLSLDQAEFRKKNLVSELQESLQHNRCHILKYVIDASVSKINLDVFVSSLETLKKLVDKTSEFLTSKKEQKLDLFFNTVFSGSFGILLTTSYDDMLVESTYEKTFGSVFEILNAITTENESKIHSIIQDKLKGNRKLIRKYSNFFESVSYSLNAVELEWKEPNNNEHKVKIEFEKAKRLYSLFKEHEKHEEEIVELTGYVKGLSLINYNVEFQRSVQQRKEIIRARFDKKLAEEVKSCLDVFSKAKFKVLIELNEITEEEKKKWELLEITKTLPVALSDKDVVELHGLHKEIIAGISEAEARQKGLLTDEIEPIEKEKIREVLERCNYNQTEAAARLGLKMTSLQYKMKKYNLVKDEKEEKDV